MMNLEEHLKNLAEEGVTIIPGAYSRSVCDDYTKRSRELLERRMAEGIAFNEASQFISSPFRHDVNFADLLYQKELNEVLSAALDPDYVLINTNIISRIQREDIAPGQKYEIGGNWHTDSRYLGGRRLDWGFSYIVVTMFTDFTPQNGATLYVPQSHLRREKPEREANYPSKQLCGEAGTIAIYDSGLWHRAGPASDSNERWGLFSLYGPWFMKPYFRYPDMMGEEFGKKIDKNLRRLLHYNSNPPIHDDERDFTIVRD